MAKEVIWTALAIKDLQNLEDYLTNNWPDSVTEAFFDKLQDILKLISTYPATGELQLKNIHSISVTKHNRLFYRVDELEISILRLYDTRQDPSKFRLI